jgi:broad specificity phosphatase PhoE
MGHLAGRMSWGRVRADSYYTRKDHTHPQQPNRSIPVQSANTTQPSRSPSDITARCDSVIADIRRRFHAHAIGKPKGSVNEPFDVLVVAHGHFLRAFAGRWIGKNIADNPSLILEAGGVGTLSYEHHNLNEPAILLGGAFMSDVVEDAEKKTEEQVSG